MTKNHWPVVALLVATCLSRIPFRAHVPYGLDSIQFVLGLRHYDVRLHQPQPPGYFLFVMMGRVVNKLIQDPNLSFIALNILFSGLAVWLVFLLGKEIFGARSGLSSALLLATSPIFWFHGEVALSNLADCFFVCLLALCCWRNLEGNYRFMNFSAVVLGLAGGVRQNTILFLLPLWIVSVRKAGLKRMALAVAILMMTVCAWYVPMAHLSGGLKAYQIAVRDHWLNSNWHGFTLGWLPFNLVCVGYFILLGTGPGMLLLFLGGIFYLEKAHLDSLWRDHRFQLFAAWLIPPVSFFILIYSHPIQTGHSLIYLPALLILMPAGAQLTCEQILGLFKSKQGQFRGKDAVVLRRGETKSTLRSSRWLPLSIPSQIVPLVLVGCNLFTFLKMNTSVSRLAVAQYESKLKEVVTTVKEQFSPETTILMNYDFMFLGFRDYMFHLPEYHTYQPKLYTLAGRTLLFAGFRQETRLIDRIEIPATTNFFVLNADELLKDPSWIHRLRIDKFSDENLLMTPSGLTLFRGDVRDLPRFFPQIQFNIHKRRDFK